MQVFCQLYVLQYFFPICNLSIHFLNSVFLEVEIFNFGEVQLIIIFFIINAFSVLSKKCLPIPRLQNLSCFVLEIFLPSVDI